METTVGIGYSYDEDQGLHLSVWADLVTADHWRAHVAERLTDPRALLGHRWLGDIRRWRPDLSITADVIEEMATGLGGSGLAAGKAVAIVAGSGYWDARTFEALLGQHAPDVTVFHEFPTACRSLGIDPARTTSLITEMVIALREG